MKKILAILLFCFTTTIYAQKSMPARLDRAHSYFGLHFDFHAGPDAWR
jgi:hypothetical protein